VTETCLALTIFREEINFHVMALFTALIFLKVFHWLAQSRIEFVRARCCSLSLLECLANRPTKMSNRSSRRTSSLG
jgi:hypothetical protein